MTTAPPAPIADGAGPEPAEPPCPPGPGPIADLMFDFLGYLELERGLSRNTLEAYRNDLQQFGKFISRRGLDPLTITPPELAAFVSELADGGDGRAPVSAATLQRKVACLRS